MLCNPCNNVEKVLKKTKHSFSFIFTTGYPT